MTSDTTKQAVPGNHQLWQWAEGIMHGSGASTRSAHRAAPTLHIFAEGDKMWCSGGRGVPFVSIRPKYCSQCLSLARDMWSDLID